VVANNALFAAIRFSIVFTRCPSCGSYVRVKKRECYACDNYDYCGVSTTESCRFCRCSVEDQIPLSLITVIRPFSVVGEHNIERKTHHVLAYVSYSYTLRSDIVSGIHFLLRIVQKCTRQDNESLTDADEDFMDFMSVSSLPLNLSKFKQNVVMNI